ncbi:RING/U-box superfamily protein [Striga asiatica]|uniref:RING-type E3 ubiquitin transferase n=1 Tax=Striga asiatica TaxID=4170 RepID=A0A5A7R419_STRAF|nr:RING/U-box superfamily protein [Striga asiatica]
MASILNLHHVLFLFLFLSLVTAQQQSENTNTTATPPPAGPTPAGSGHQQFKPGIAVTVGIFTTIFSVTFLLLLYVKHCNMDSSSSPAAPPPSCKNSGGADRLTIQSLPIFRFSSLKGHKKDGLECAVCLNRFDPDEFLRLLPKCSHAFHVECVDTWLEAHPTCPLCRCRVGPEDTLYSCHQQLYSARQSSSSSTAQYSFPVDHQQQLYSARLSSTAQYSCPVDHQQLYSARLSSGRHDSSTAQYNCPVDCSARLSSSGRRHSDGSLEIIVEDRYSGRRRSRRRDTGLLMTSPGVVLGEKRRVEHRIIISGGGEEEEEGRCRRWSDVEAGELLYLRSEMMMIIGERSVSEIMGLRRCEGRGGRRKEGEGVVKRWLAWISHAQPSTEMVGSSSAASADSASTSAATAS